MKEGDVLRKYKDDIIIGLIIIIVIVFLLYGFCMLHLVLSFFLLIISLPSMGKDENKFYENQVHENDTSEVQLKDTVQERPAYSLRVDESQFWENRVHDESEELSDTWMDASAAETDYSTLDPCFLGDRKKKR